MLSCIGGNCSRIYPELINKEINEFFDDQFFLNSKNIVLLFESHFILIDFHSMRATFFTANTPEQHELNSNVSN